MTVWPISAPVVVPLIVIPACASARLRTLFVSIVEIEIVGGVSSTVRLCVAGRPGCRRGRKRLRSPCSRRPAAQHRLSSWRPERRRVHHAARRHRRGVAAAVEPDRDGLADLGARGGAADCHPRLRLGQVEDVVRFDRGDRNRGRDGVDGLDV